MKLKDKITQGMLEDYEEVIRAADTEIGLAKFRGINARAAHDAGWFEGECDLDDPAAILEMSRLATEKYRALLSIDPHNNGGGAPRPEPEGEPAAA